MRLTRNQFLSGAQVQILPTSLCPFFCSWVRGAAAAYGTSDPLTSVRFRPDSEKELARGRGIDTPNLQTTFVGGLAQMVERSLSMFCFLFALLAQLVERETSNLEVAGSIPAKGLGPEACIAQWQSGALVMRRSAIRSCVQACLFFCLFST